jgi:hypothetical protein
VADEWVVQNRETGRLESSVVPQATARDYASQANRNHQSDAYVAVEWKGSSDA